MDGEAEATHKAHRKKASGPKAERKKVRAAVFFRGVRRGCVWS